MQNYSRIWKLCFIICLAYSIAVSDAAIMSSTSSLGHIRSPSDDVVILPGDGNNQVTGCRISTKELLASAESTARAILQAVYNPRVIEDRLHNIESQMADQLNVIKTMILNIEDKLAQQDVQYRRANRKLHGAVAELTESVQSCATLQQSVTHSNKVESSPATGKRNLKNQLTPGSNTSTSFVNNSNEPKFEGGIKSTGTDPADEEEDLLNPRLEEIERFNSSIHTENGKRVFSYYWKISDMEYKLNSWGPRRSLRSPSFYIFEYGYMMYIRLFPRQNGQNVYTHVGITKGNYDEALEWPFLLKHRISVLDQTQPPFQDIVSRIWDPKILCSAWNWKRPVTGDNHECVGLGFPSEDLRGHSFIYDDSIIVKLTVYLD